MSEINERAVVIFLLKKMGFKSVDERNYKRPYYQMSGGKVILFAVKSEPGFFFFPFSDISHAWMVVEKLLETTNNAFWIGNEGDGSAGWFVALNKNPNPSVVLPETGYEFYKNLTAPEAITIAAARALASDEEIVEFGL